MRNGVRGQTPLPRKRSLRRSTALALVEIAGAQTPESFSFQNPQRSPISAIRDQLYNCASPGLTAQSMPHPLRNTKAAANEPAKGQKLVVQVWRQIDAHRPRVRALNPTASILGTHSRTNRGLDVAVLSLGWASSCTTRCPDRPAMGLDSGNPISVSLRMQPCPRSAAKSAPDERGVALPPHRQSRHRYGVSGPDTSG